MVRTFRYVHGVAGETMTVAELRTKLSEYPDDMPVFGGWEGVVGYISRDGFSVDFVHKGVEADGCNALIIDVEDY